MAVREEKKGVLLGIQDVLDESDRNGMRVVVKVKKDYDPRAIVDLLFKYTNLQVSFSINMVAIAEGKPQTLSLLQIYNYYVNYQRDFVVKRTKCELEKAKKQKDKENLAQTLEETRKAIRAHLKENTDEIDPVFKTEMGDYKLPRELRAGDGVIVVDLDKKGEVVSSPDKKGNVMVKVGNATMKMSCDRLMLIDGKTIVLKEKKKTISLYKEHSVESFAPQLDLRGKYGDEACEMVDKYIDDALRVGMKTIRIVHGKGTGVLRRRVTEFLKTDKRVSSVRIGEWGEGDTGVSIAELK
jgi:dsDNA-specific endonuclease/ATPase MutS2